MARALATPVYVPHEFGEGVTVADVVWAGRQVDDRVNAGEVLAELRGGGVHAAVESPLTGVVSKLYVQQGKTAHAGQILAEIVPDVPRAERPVASPNSSAGWLVERTPALAALALAAPALRWPFAWSIVAVAVALFAAAAGSVKPAPPSGPADVLVIPFRIIFGGLGFLASRLYLLLAALLGLAGCLVLGVVLSGGLGVLTWVIEHGTDGTKSAMRLAVNAYSLRVAAFILCLWMLAGLVRGERVRGWITDAAGRLPELGLTLAALVVVLWLGLCAFVLPSNLWWPYSGRAALAKALPGAADNVRRSLAEHQAGAVVSCLADQGRHGWRPPRAHLRPDGTILVGIRSEKGARIGDRALATLMLALNNQLAPSGPAIAIARGGQTVGFTPQPATKPLADFSKLPFSAHTTDADLKLALSCSAAALI